MRKILKLECAVLDWYYNHIYDGHFRLAKGGGRKTNGFAMFYKREEFGSRPRNNKDAERIHCKNVNDEDGCLANIEYCVYDGALKFKFNPHSALERHNHSSNSDWTVSDYDSEPEPEPKAKAKPFTAPRQIVTDDDFDAEAVFGLSNRNNLNLIEPGTPYKYYKGKSHPSTGSYVWQCAQQNKTTGRCNRRALVKTLKGIQMVAFLGKHNH